MTPVRVRCVETVGVDGDSDHRHVVALETDGADGRPFRWTVVQAIAAMRDGQVFVVDLGGRAAAPVLDPAVCQRCRQVTVATDPPEALLAVVASR